MMSKYPIIFKKTDLPEISLFEDSFSVKDLDTNRIKFYTYSEVKAVSIKSDEDYILYHLQGSINLARDILGNDDHNFRLRIEDISGTPWEYKLRTRPDREFYELIDTLNSISQSE